MKLRNKKTGEIREVNNILVDDMFRVNSLAELNDEWEDYEEPKDFWYIDDFMIMCGTEGEFTTPDLATFTKRDIEKLKQIGNYFETKEEAEKAVEKLKAWKRLKDKGFRFTGFNRVSVDYGVNSHYGISQDLDLLFGGEE